MVTRKEQEYQTLSNITGLPVDEIDIALGVWDTLFPTPTPWMTTMNHGGLYYMRFFPSPLRGLGVNYRRHQYAPDGMEDSEELFNNLKSIVGDYCYNDMIHWNNAAYIMLERDQNLHQQVGGTPNKFERHVKAAVDYIFRKDLYSDVQSLTDLAIEAKCRNFNVQGFFCTITPELYDLYIVKSNNNLLKFPVNQVVEGLHLNQGHMRYCFVMGTDEQYKLSDDDTIWITGTLHHSSLDNLNSVIGELDKIV